MDLQPWIDQQKKAGYSNVQIKSTLRSQGYTAETINQYFNKAGLIMKVLGGFYVLLALIGIVLVSVFADEGIANYFSIPNLLMSMVGSVVFILGMAAYYWKSGKKGESLIFLFFQWITPFSVVVGANSFLAFGTLTTYFLIIVYAILFGTFFAYVLDMITGTKEFLNSSVMMSTFVAAALAPNHTVYNVITSLTQKLAAVPQNAAGGTLVDLFKTPGVSPTLLFVIVMICFSAPGIMAYLQKPDADKKQLAKYIIPVIFYIVVILVLNYISSGLTATI